MLCKGKTKAGIACQNKAVFDGYCKLHHPSVTMKYDDLTKAYRDTMKHIDMVKELQDSLKLSDPMREYREVMKHVDTMKGLRDSMKFLDAMEEYQRSMKHVDMVKERQDSMKLSDSMREYREAIKHVHSMKGIQESIKFILPSERFKDALGATNLWDQFGSLHQQIKNLQSSINANSIGSLIKEVKALNTQAGITDFGVEPSINTDGTLAFSLDSIELQPLHDLGSQVILHAMQRQSANILEAIERLAVEIRLLKDPLVQKILIQLIFPVVITLVFAFFNPVSDFYVKNYLNKHEKKQISVQINHSVVENVISKEVLIHLRYVKADVLCVRKSESKSGQLIGYLYFGQVVEILEKRKNWSRIKWVDETGKMSIEGWVFTRYLKKFN